MRAVPLLTLAVLLLPGCSGPDSPTDEPAEDEATAAQEAEGEAPAEPPLHTAETPRFEPPGAGEQVEIPAGTLQLGSRPGTVGRDARNEADLQPLDVPAFRIDRLPYPNDPAEPPRTDVTREQAAGLCAERGQRLCSELEWERACKGNRARPFPGGERFDAERCAADPAACASPFGVLDLGVRAAEWTASEAGPGLARGEATAVVRGAGADAAASRHRCGARRAADPTTHSATTGFRCCSGAAPELSYPEPPVTRAFEPREVDTERLRSILRELPALAPWAEGFRPRGPMGVAAALGQSEPPEVAPNGWAASTAPVLVWSPVRGEQAWVLAGTTEDAGVLAVIQPTRDGFIHAASFILEGDPEPIAVLHTPDAPRELQWTTCWSCTGESGTVEYRDDGTFAVLHH